MLTPLVYLAKSWHPSQGRLLFLLVDSDNNSLAGIHTVHNKSEDPQMFPYI